MSIPFSHTVFEISCYLMIVVCCIFRIRKGTLPFITIIWELLSIIALGMTIEIFSVALGGFSYSPSHLTILGVPLYIGFGWAAIVFSTMWLTDSLKMPDWTRVLLGTFLAVLLNLSFETTAVRDGMWFWIISSKTNWYGVPGFNFLAWWTIIFSILSAITLVRELGQKKVISTSSPIYPILICLLTPEIILAIWIVQIFENQFITFTVLMITSFVSIVWKWRGIKKPISIKKDFPIYFVPCLFYSLFLFILLIKEYFEEALPTLWINLFLFAINAIFLAKITIMGNLQRTFPKSLTKNE